MRSSHVRLGAAACFLLFLFVAVSCPGTALGEMSAIEKARKLKMDAAKRARERMASSKGAPAEVAKPAKKDEPKGKVAPKKKAPKIEPLRPKKTADKKNDEEEEDKPKPPTCFDGIKNGDEADIDCGGKCRAQIRVRNGHSYPRLCVQEQGCRSDSDCFSKLCDKKRNKCKPRPMGMMYTKEELKLNMHIIFDEISQQHADSKLRPKNVDAFIKRCINPDKQEMTKEQEKMVDDAIAAFKTREGLHERHAGDTSLPHGYLTRGKPFKFIHGLARKLAQETRAKREL